jgi:hypothetical protein
MRVKRILNSTYTARWELEKKIYSNIKCCNIVSNEHLKHTIALFAIFRARNERILIIQEKKTTLPAACTSWRSIGVHAWHRTNHLGCSIFPPPPLACSHAWKHTLGASQPSIKWQFGSMAHKLHHEDCWRGASSGSYYSTPSINRGAPLTLKTQHHTKDQEHHTWVSFQGLRLQIASRLSQERCEGE